MIDAILLCKLHLALSVLKSEPSVSFGAINIVFFGDFLQLPTVTNLEIYSKEVELPVRWRQASSLWRSLNAVVILLQQMRQISDLLFSQMLHRIRLRVPTDEDIDLLNSRIGALLPNLSNVPIIVRRHSLRNSINHQKLFALSETTDIPITYCVATILDKHNMSLDEIYQIKSDSKTPGDAILTLLPGCPLMITKNINRPLGTTLKIYSSTQD